jgi:hypothetical protein
MAVTNNLYAYIIDALDAWKSNDVTKMTAAVTSINALALSEPEINSVNDTINIEAGNNFQVNDAYRYAIGNLSCITDRATKQKIADIYAISEEDFSTAKKQIEGIIADTDTSYINASVCTVIIRICLHFGLYDQLTAIRSKFVAA